MSANVFSPDYAAARETFRAAALDAGAHLSAFPLDVRGPTGGELSTDVAWLGPEDASKVLVLASGVHGVEGYCGSGVQVAWLRRGEAAALPEGVAAMLVHAVNPYGFAWDRRVNEDNVDLNRNWIDFAHPPPSNPTFDLLAEVLAPSEWTDESRARTRQALRDFSARHGPRALQDAISRGQYRHPRGIFYGGGAATWSRRMLERLFSERLARAAAVAVIDIHTGLGPEGIGERISSAVPEHPAYARARAWYGEGVTSYAAGDSSSAELTGDWLAAAPSLAPQAEVTAIALEFGTVSSARVLDALRADAWLHAYGDPAGTAADPVRRQMRQAFYVDSDIWRGQVMGQGLLAARQAARGLAA